MRKRDPEIEVPTLNARKRGLFGFDRLRRRLVKRSVFPVKRMDDESPEYQTGNIPGKRSGFVAPEVASTGKTEKRNSVDGIPEEGHPNIPRQVVPLKRTIPEQGQYQIPRQETHQDLPLPGSNVPRQQVVPLKRQFPPVNYPAPAPGPGPYVENRDTQMKKRNPGMSVKSVKMGLNSRHVKFSGNSVASSEGNPNKKPGGYSMEKINYEAKDFSVNKKAELNCGGNTVPTIDDISNMRENHQEETGVSKYINIFLLSLFMFSICRRLWNCPRF